MEGYSDGFVRLPFMILSGIWWKGSIVPLFVELCRIMAMKAAWMTKCGESFGRDGWKSIVLV